MRSIECTFEEEVAAVSAQTVQRYGVQGYGVQGYGVQGYGVQRTGGQRSSVRGHRVRLTRRGRVLVVLTALVLIVVGFSMGRVSSQAASSTHRVTPPTVTVQPGESLWQLATRVAPRVDPRLVVDQIVHLNHLASPQVFAGQQLVIPRAG